MTSRPYKFVIVTILVLHVLLTPIFVQMAYEDRGQMAVGGEYFVLPLIGMALFLIVRAFETFKNKPKRRMNHGKSNSNHHR